MSLITIIDINEMLDVSSNLDYSRIQRLIHEREKIKSIEFLGPDLYDELKQADLNEPIWANLLEKVRPVLVYWTYASYLMKGQIFNTATGPVVKITENSTSLSDKELEMAVNDTCNIARFYEKELYLFLEKNKEDYPSYESYFNDKNGVKHTGCKTFLLKKSCNNEEL